MSCAACVPLCISSALSFDTWKIHLDPRIKSITLLGFSLPFESLKVRNVTHEETDSRETEKDKPRWRLTDRGRHPQREKGKRRDGITDLRIVLSAALIFAFHCFSTTVIRVKVTWVSVQRMERYRAHWKMEDWRKVKSTDNPAQIETKDDYHTLIYIHLTKLWLDSCSTPSERA